jgi:putative ferrous iron transport protein C
VILTKIRDYVQSRGRATASDIAIHFELTEDMVTHMMSHLLAPRGKIRRLTGTGCSSCSGCSGCSVQMSTIYEWIEEESSST